MYQCCVGTNKCCQNTAKGINRLSGGCCDCNDTIFEKPFSICTLNTILFVTIPATVIIIIMFVTYGDVSLPSLSNPI